MPVESMNPPAPDNHSDNPNGLESAGSNEPPLYKDKPLPELAVKSGKWFNADQPPTLAALKGKTVLVVLTTLF